MTFKIFTLYPQLFENFLTTSLVARSITKDILKFELINWRDFGLGNYRQVDDRPFGGGSGMVLRPEPIFAALLEHQALSDFTYQQFQKSHPDSNQQNHQITRNDQTASNQNKPTNESQPDSSDQPKSYLNLPVIPRNADFYRWQNQESTSNSTEIQNFQVKPFPQSAKKAVIMLTPRGFPLNQKICHWLAGFDQISLLCGRFEGFDARVNSVVDLEISIGNFVTNGGEVPAMCLIEAVSRLVEGFMTKVTSHEHDSFSRQPNYYDEQSHLVTGQKKLDQWQQDWYKLQQIKQKLTHLNHG